MAYSIGTGGYLSQELKFFAPVCIGDTIIARAEVIEIIEDKNRVRLKTIYRNQDKNLVVDGLALVMSLKANGD